MNTLRRPNVFGLIAAFSMAVASFSFAASTSASAAHPAQVLVKDATERLLSSDVSDARGDSDALRAEVARVVVPHFDLKFVSRRVLGKHWDSASTAQRESFTALLRRYLTDTYAGFVLDYRGERVDYLPIRERGKGQRVQVRTKIRKSDGPEVRVDYGLFHTNDNNWKVYDVVANGVSLVTLYKVEFANEIRRSGMDGLLAQLNDRLQAEAGS